MRCERNGFASQWSLISEGNVKVSRRAILRGAGVSLALPWLESWRAPGARAAGASAPKRMLAIYFPMGTSSFWKPSKFGTGDEWQLSPILEPFAPVKDQLIVLGGVENNSPMTDQHYIYRLPYNTAMWLSCTDPEKATNALKVTANGVTMDQLIAQRIGSQTPLPSLALGLSTYYSWCDGKDCSYSRNISWSKPTEVVPRKTDPKDVWDALFPGAGGSSQSALDRSVLDTVLKSAEATRSHLGKADQQRLDEYLSRVRELEQRVAQQCVRPPRPTGTTPVSNQHTSSDTYDRGQHADLMNDLIALAIQCDRTRVITHMLDDEHAEFIYSHVGLRSFSSTGSQEVAPPKRLQFELYGMQQSEQDGSPWASANRWFCEVTSRLCQKLAAMPEGEGSVLDNTVVFFGSNVENGHRSSANLPLTLLGGRGILKQNQSLNLAAQGPQCALRDVHFTLLNRVFDLNLTSFGESVLTTQNRIVPELLA